MPERPKTHDEQLEEMVAYLDGELSADESLRVEQRLAADEPYRQRLQRLERAWNVLDELPLPTVDDRFSRTTMTMVVQAAAQDVEAKTVALPVVQRRRRWSTAMVAIAAAALGFLVLQLLLRNPNAALVADLPVIDNVDLYSQIGDFAFLARLHAELPSELTELAGDSNEAAVRLKQFGNIAAPADREQWLVDLSDEDRATLRAKSNRYRNLSPEQQGRLRDLHHAIVASPNAAELEETMFVYQQWLGGLPPARQFELRDQPADQRVETVKQWASQMRDDALLTLTDDELKALFQRVRKPLIALRGVQGRNDGRALNRNGRERDRAGIFSQPLSTYRIQLNEHFGPGAMQQRAFYLAVVEALPQRTREPFEQLSRRDQVDRFIAWMRQYADLVGEVSQEDLERFFAEELDVDTRTELLKLPPGQMEEALRIRYRRQPGADFARGGRWEGGPGGRNRPWPDDPRRGPGPGGPGPGGPGGPGHGPDGRPHGPGFGGPGEGFGPPPDGFGPPRGPRNFDGPPDKPPRDFGPPPRPQPN